MPNPDIPQEGQRGQTFGPTDYSKAFDRYLEGKGNLIQALRRFSLALLDYDRMVKGMDVAAWMRSDAFEAGGAAVVELLQSYPGRSAEFSYVFDQRVLSTDRPSPEIVDPSVDALLIASTALLGGSRRFDFHPGPLLQLVFGGDPVSQLFRSAILGAPLPGDPRFKIGQYPIPIVPGVDQAILEKLTQWACYRGLEQSLLGITDAVNATPHVTAYPNTRITDLKPRRECPGRPVEIVGTGFGEDQPVDAIVVFGSTRADVVSWSPTSIVVIVPQDTSECCVSVLRVTQGGSSNQSVVEATLDYAGVLSTCFGKVGVAAAQRVNKLASIHNLLESTCQPDGSNRFIGGKPRIRWFRTNVGDQSPQRVSAIHLLELDWAIDNADSVAIAINPAANNARYAVTPTLPNWFTPDPRSGKVELAFAPGLLPWKVTITLDATNQCGSVSGVIEVEYSPEIGLVFVGGGMRSAFHLGALEAMATILPSPPTIYAGNGLGALAAVSAAADFPDISSLRNFWDSSIDETAWFREAPMMFAARSILGADISAFSNVYWQAQARSEVLGLGALGLMRTLLVPHRFADPRDSERIMTVWALKGIEAGVDEAVSELGPAVSEVLGEAGVSALSSVPIVAIIYAAAKFAVTTFLDAQKQQTAAWLTMARGIFDPSHLNALILTVLAGADQRIQGNQHKIRIPLSSLELGQVVYGLEGGSISGTPVLSQIRANAGAISSTVSASAVVPLLTPPVKIGPDSLVDGSLCDPVPIGVTIEAGAGAVIVIQPNIRRIAEAGPFDFLGLPHIDARSSLIRDAQFLDGSAEPFRRFSRDPMTGPAVGSWRVPVHFVEPSIDILGLGMTYGQIGLTNIMIDYGYMRAYDVVVPKILFPRVEEESERLRMTDELSALTDKIVQLRIASWEAEHWLNGMRTSPFGPTNRIAGGGPLVAVPDAGAIDHVRELKSQIRDALNTRLGVRSRYDPGATPGEPIAGVTTPPVPRHRAEDWFMNWEQYNFNSSLGPTTPMPGFPQGNPWVSISFGSQWTVPAAAPPAALVFP